jgi:D-cysteine desulfhydrase
MRRIVADARVGHHQSRTGPVEGSFASMSRTQPLLFERYPVLQSHVPWLPLGTFPTPNDRVQVIDAAGHERTVLVKREDLCNETYAGNKIRKLEFILADARRRGAGRLITVGAAGSHHGLATAVHGKACGLGVSLVLFPQPLTPHVADILRMDQAMGAEIRWIPRMELVPLALLRARLAWRAERPYPVAAGGSDAIGTLGWVDAGLELGGQIASGETERPGVIHVAAGTLGTAAGLALGLALAGHTIRIAATRITSRIITNERTLATLVRGAAAKLRLAGIESPVDQAIGMVEIRHDQIGRGYGKVTEAAVRAEASFAAAGIRLDDTYTAKAAADLLATTEAEPVLFINTLSASEPRDLVDSDVIAQLPTAVASYLAGERAHAPD